MRFEHNGRKWMIKKNSSCFVSRTGKYDVSILAESKHGSRETDGKLYNRLWIIAAEDGDIIRRGNSLPDFITAEWLKQNAFIDSCDKCK